MMRELLDYRLLAFANIRKAAQSAVSNHSRILSDCRKHGTVITIGLCRPQYRVYSDYRFIIGGKPPLLLQNAKDGLCRGYFARNHSFLSASGAAMMAQHAQVAWKRLARKCSASRRTSPGISRIAQAVSLALSRSHLIVPSVLGLTYGRVALAQRTLVEPEDYSSWNSFSVRAQNGHAFVSSLLLSVLEGVVLLVRALYLTVLFSPSIIMAPFSDSCGPQFRKKWFEVVLHTLEMAGPAFIKWGQWAATRPDLFPRDLCIKLSELHCNAPEHSFSYTKKTIESAFGRKLSEVFEHFEEEPVASGSIAQVHRATLRFRYPGQLVKPLVVAVKVRHPGVGESIRRDFMIINSVAKLSRFIPTLNWLRLDESVQQFGVFMMSQVDLAREAAHLNRFIYNFRRWRDVSFPKPLYPLAAVAHIGTHALLKMLLVDNFIHADMHPGNILVRVSKNKASRKRLLKSKPHVVFLDVGMTAELSNGDRLNLLEFFKAVARRDGRTAAECTLRLSQQQNCPNPKAFIEEVEEAFTFWGTPEGDLVHPADCMLQLLEKVRCHRVNIDGNVCTVMVTTLVLEGWQRKLDPGYNIMHTLQTLLLKADWAKSLSYTIDGLMAP
ncbi:hypothetical protein F3Y22_tig00111070pilonHSYRG00082 [Hibiscus syriacus]|uniref:ABC1 atypical kinase-like domain-containing protein n=1 Tax=Hibiscus syriacus TaxID=106335 RepID=A0A6A2Z5A9_HIBSY|nr:hypothetical protein F3Y22_tig00111070pilonHSYRG00082 [Hibiscus syriacus]